jgi:hypothetical protein
MRAEAEKKGKKKADAEMPHYRLFRSKLGNNGETTGIAGGRSWLKIKKPA